MSNFRRLVISGFKWSSVSQLSRLSAQLMGVLILARLLPSTDFGLIAMATTVTGFASLFRDLGTAAAIIQKSDPSPQMLDSVFWLNIAFGLALAALVGLFAPLITSAFAEPRLIYVLWALLLTFPIVSLGTVHQALLEKKSYFRSLAIIESISAFSGLGAAILAAMAGWGVYSLVLQNLLTGTLNVLGLWINSKWRPSFRLRFSEIRNIMGFSGNLLGFNVCNYFIRNADNLLIGRFLGASDLGYYSMAYRLMLWPLQNISNVVGRALFPVFSGLKDDHVRLSSSYIQATRAITLITAPLMLGFFVLREPFVTTALGERWLPVSEVLVWLVPVGLLQSIGTSVGTLYLATGRTDVMFKWGFGAGLLVIPAFAIGLQWGITGVAAAYAFASLLLFYPGLAIPLRFVNLPVFDVLTRLMPSLFTAVAMAGIVALSSILWPANASYQLLRLSALITIGIVTYGGISLFTQRPLLTDIARAIFKR